MNGKICLKRLTFYIEGELKHFYLVLIILHIFFVYYLVEKINHGDNRKLIKKNNPENIVCLDKSNLFALIVLYSNEILKPT